MAPGRKPLAPLALPILGHLLPFQRDRLGFLARAAREHGDVVPLRFGPRRCLLLSHPDHVHEVLATGSAHFVKGYSVRMLRGVLGDGLLVSEGDRWRRQRRVVQPVLRRERAEADSALIVEIASRRAATWTAGVPIDLHHELARITMEVGARIVLGISGSDERGDLHPALEGFLRASSARPSLPLPFIHRIPTPGTLRARARLRALDALVYATIAERRRSGVVGHDLLSALLSARDDQGAPLDEREMRDQIVTVLLGAHDTTANALAWSFYLLDRYPATGERLRGELRHTLGGRAPGVADLARLPYVEAVLLETLRLYPPGWALSRDAVEDCEVGGHPVSAGTTVVVSQWVVHRDPRWWERPDEFRPERWQDGLADRLPKGAYFPFGIGQRNCVGSRYAMVELAIILATIAQRARLELVAGHRVVPQPIVSLRPRYGLRVVPSLV